MSRNYARHVIVHSHFWTENNSILTGNSGTVKDKTGKTEGLSSPRGAAKAPRRCVRPWDQAQLAVTDLIEIWNARTQCSRSKLSRSVHDSPGVVEKPVVEGSKRSARTLSRSLRKPFISP